MKTYTKPVISIDQGLAEGIYAASGNNPNPVTLSELSKTADWGSDNGQLSFSADFSNLSNLSQLTLSVTFNHPIDNAWGGGASVSWNGNTAKFSWYSAPVTAEGLMIQVSAHLSEMAISSFSYSNN